jgi:hypothetical protein
VKKTVFFLSNDGICYENNEEIERIGHIFDMESSPKSHFMVVLQLFGSSYIRGKLLRMNENYLCDDR